MAATARSRTADHGLFAMLMTFAMSVANGTMALEDAQSRMSQALSAKSIGKGLVTVGLVIVVLNQVFTIDSINNSTGPFASVIPTVENIGTSALTLVTIAFLVLAGAVAMNFMDRF